MKNTEPRRLFRGRKEDMRRRSTEPLIRLTNEGYRKLMNDPKYGISNTRGSLRRLSDEEYAKLQRTRRQIKVEREEKKEND